MKEKLLIGILFVGGFVFGQPYKIVELSCSRTFHEVMDSGVVHNSKTKKEFAENCRERFGGRMVNPGECARQVGHVWCVYRRNAIAEGYGTGANCAEAQENSRVNCSNQLPQQNCYDTWSTGRIQFSRSRCH